MLENVFLTHKAVNTGWWEINIHGCYSLVKIAFAPICAARTIDEYESWGDLPMIFTRDEVTSENHWQKHLKSDQKIVIHRNSCIILYIPSKDFNREIG